jgi:hypothetical protein
MSAAYRHQSERIRVLFAFGVSPEFFNLPGDRIGVVIDALKETFAGLDEKFGVRVLGTLDDDETMIGPSTTWPWTCYILADAPDRDAVSAVCNLLRETPVDGDRLWRYVTVEARLGRPLFFGEP